MCMWERKKRYVAGGCRASVRFVEAVLDKNLLPVCCMVVPAKDKECRHDVYKVGVGYDAEIESYQCGGKGSFVEGLRCHGKCNREFVGKYSGEQQGQFQPGANPGKTVYCCARDFDECQCAYCYDCFWENHHAMNAGENDATAGAGDNVAVPTGTKHRHLDLDLDLTG